MYLLFDYLQFIELLLNEFQNVINLAEGIFHRVVTIDRIVVVAMEIIGANWFGLGLIYLETLFDGLVVVISSTASLTTVQKTLDDLVFLNEHVEEHSLHVAALEKELKSFRLRYCTWETIEDNALAIFWKVVQIAFDEVNHFVVWNEVTSSYEFADFFTEFAT